MVFTFKIATSVFKKNLQMEGDVFDMLCPRFNFMNQDSQEHILDFFL